MMEERSEGFLSLIDSDFNVNGWDCLLKSPVLYEQQDIDYSAFETPHSSDKDVEPFTNPATDSTSAWSGPYAMSRVDWRWAAEKGYYDPQTKRWNTSKGGYEAYDRQRKKPKQNRKDAKQQSAAQDTGSMSLNTVHFSVIFEGSNQDVLPATLTRTGTWVERPIPFRTCTVAFDQVGKQSLEATAGH